ncbi:MAG TPA: DUF6390 family protein [Dehalococcoidia bacterium]|nr:DUF6390 family protein [Dehalococcoidia bacterium]
MPDGRLLFAHYALMPNRLGYCGGSDSQTLFDYCVAHESDAGMDSLIHQFQAAYPYLKFIAQSNGIADPLDPRVVEAYWLGNDLLARVTMIDFHNYLKEQIGPRVPEKALRHLIGKAPAGARPHHSFHVLDVSMRTGALRESLDDLDRCRISWAAVRNVDGDSLMVSHQPLVFDQGKLTLGGPEDRRVSYRVHGRGYLTTPQPGDVVAVHWDWVCDVLTPDKAAALELQTRYHLAIANQTLW